MEGGKKRHQSLSAPHVPLKKPLHSHGGGHVFADLLEGSPLVAGQAHLQGALEGLGSLFGREVGPLLLLLLGETLEEHHSEVEEEELLEDQALPGLFQPLPLTLMEKFQAGGPARKLQLLPHPFGEDLVDGTSLESLRDQVRQRPSPQGLDLPVEGKDSLPGLLRRDSEPSWHHLQSPPGLLLNGSVEGQPKAGLERGQKVLLVEEEERQRRLRIPHPGLDQGHPPLGDPPESGPQDLALHPPREGGGDPGGVPHVGAVLKPEGEGEEEIFHALDSLLSEEEGPLGPHPGESLHRIRKEEGRGGLHREEKLIPKAAGLWGESAKGSVRT